MVAIQAKVYNFDSITTLKCEDPSETLIVKKAFEKVENYKQQLFNLEKNAIESGSPEFKENLKSVLPSWWEYHTKALESGSYDEKYNIYSEGERNYPNSYDLAYYFAKFLESEGKMALAGEKYREVLDLKPDWALARSIYADFLVKDNRPKEAENHYLASIEQEAEDGYYQLRYANFLSRIRPIDAEKYFLKALKLRPEDSNYNGYYAVFLGEQERIVDAEKYYLISIELKPDDDYFLPRYGNFLLNQNRLLEAEQYLKKSLDYNSESELANLYYEELQSRKMKT